MTLILSGSDGVSDIDGSASTPAIRGTDANTGIFFPAADTIAFSEGGAEVARFDSSGRFGVGTASPASTIQAGAKTSSTSSDVSTIFSAGGASASGGQIYAATFCNTVTPTNNNEVLISFTPGSNYSSTSAIGCMIENTVNAYSCLKFYSYGGALTERARIGSNGFFRIGMGNYANDPSSSNYGWSLEQNGSNPFINHATSGTGTSTMIAFINGNGSRGSIQTNATNTLYNTTSDYRLKENVAPMTGALVKVSQLKPSTYTWKVDGSEGQGFIAHELAEVCPDAVSGEKDAVDEKGDPKYQMIDTSFLVATLTAAIQELKAINDAQASRIETLEAKVAALEAK